MLRPPLAPADLAREPAAVVWASPSVRERATALGLPFAPAGTVPAGASTVIAIGGGAYLDRAKAAVKRDGVARRLVAVPSRWGAGAEVSPIIVLDAPDGSKAIARDDAWVPDERGSWPELADTVDERTALDGCADVWAHALEAEVSPLAGPEVRAQAAAVVADLRATEDGTDPVWFELAARACAVQAQAGVGLAHGIAHVLEGATRHGHGALIAAWLPAAWALLRSRRDAPEGPPAVLHAPAVQAETAPVLRERWAAVLRDPCTRTSGCRVRRDDLEELLSWTS